MLTKRIFNPHNATSLTPEIYMVRFFLFYLTKRVCYSSVMMDMGFLMFHYFYSRFARYIISLWTHSLFIIIYRIYGTHWYIWNYIYDAISKSQAFFFLQQQQQLIKELTLSSSVCITYKSKLAIFLFTRQYINKLK